MSLSWSHAVGPILGLLTYVTVCGAIGKLLRLVAIKLIQYLSENLLRLCIMYMYERMFCDVI